MIRLSKVSKLDNILSWSLQAIETCPGSVGEDGSLVDACASCYATQGCYNFGTTKAPRLENKEDWKRDGWVDDMVAALAKQKFFRWFDSGDMYALDLAKKIYQVMVATPHVQHWLPTRMAKFAKFTSVIKDMDALPNVKVRFSSDSVIGEYSSANGSTILINSETIPGGVHACSAGLTDGKCHGCRACWDKSIPVIGYIAHGRKVQKVIKIALAR